MHRFVYDIIILNYGQIFILICSKFMLIIYLFFVVLTYLKNFQSVSIWKFAHLFTAKGLNSFHNKLGSNTRFLWQPRIKRKVKNWLLYFLKFNFTCLKMFNAQHELYILVFLSCLQSWNIFSNVKSTQAERFFSFTCLHQTPMQ